MRSKGGTAEDPSKSTRTMGHTLATLSDLYSSGTPHTNSKFWPTGVCKNKKKPPTTLEPRQTRDSRSGLFSMLRTYCFIVALTHAVGFGKRGLFFCNGSHGSVRADVADVDTCAIEVYAFPFPQLATLKIMWGLFFANTGLCLTFQH